MAAALEPLLLQSARLAVTIRHTYARVKRDPAARYYTYALLLRDNKMYVGNTDNIYTRLLDHCLMGPSSAAWVRQHGPVQRVVEISRGCARDDELYKTLEYMSMFGWKNVRGARYCRRAMRAPPAALEAFRRDSGRHFDYLSRREIDEVVAVVLSNLAERHVPAGDGDGEQA